MATLTPVTPSLAGVSLAGVSASGGGDEVDNASGDVMLFVSNGGGGSINVTLTAVQTSRPAFGAYPAMTLSNQVIAVAAGAKVLIGPIPTAFNHATTGRVTITYSGVSSVTIAAIQP